MYKYICIYICRGVEQLVTRAYMLLWRVGSGAYRFW